MGAHDGSVAERVVHVCAGEVGGALGDRPPGGRIVLRLDRHEVAHDVGGSGGRRREEALVPQPLLEDFHFSDRYTRTIGRVEVEERTVG